MDKWLLTDKEFADETGLNINWLRKDRRTSRIIPAQGALGEAPAGVAIEDLDSVLVLDSGAGTNGRGALFRVSPSTGLRTLVSDFGNAAQGPLGAGPRGLAIEATGSVLVADGDAGTNSAGALFRVEPSTGVRTVVNDFGDTAQGNVDGVVPSGVAIEHPRSVLVADGGRGLFRVDPATGGRTLLSNFANAAQGPTGVTPFGVAIQAENAFVADFGAGTDAAGALFHVNRSTGERFLLSNFGFAAQGALGVDPVGIAIDASGHVLAVDIQAGTASAGALFRVDPTTGVRTLVSDFGDADQGPVGCNPFGVASVRDLETCNGQAPTTECTVNGAFNQICLGTSADDNIIGTGSADVIVGLAGNDTISGGAGSDLICGGDGGDALNGGNGKDQLFGEAGNDTLRGNNGKDELSGGDGDDQLDGGNGKDALSGEAGDDVLRGGRGKDTLHGGADTDHYEGGPGNDAATACEPFVQ